MVVAGLAVVAALGVSLFAVASVREQKLQVDLLRTDVRELEGGWRSSGSPTRSSPAG